VVEIDTVAAPRASLPGDEPEEQGAGDTTARARIRAIHEFGNVATNFLALESHISDTLQQSTYEYVVVANGALPSHDLGGGAALPLSEDPENRRQLRIGGFERTLPFLRAQQLLTASETRECVAVDDDNQPPSSRCKRMRRIKKGLLEDWPQHMANAALQNHRLDMVIANLKPGEIAIQYDWKQNLQNTGQQCAAQKAYFCIPTSMFHGIVVYTHTGVFYYDQYSHDKTKDACLLAHCLADALEKMDVPGGLLAGVHTVHVFSDNGPPYHSGELVNLLFGRLGDAADNDFGPLVKKMLVKYKWIINYLAPGEGKGLCDAHFSKISQCVAQWKRNEIGVLTPQTMPEMFKYCTKGDNAGFSGLRKTNIQRIETTHRRHCPKKGTKYRKLLNIKQFQQFLILDDGRVYGRHYSDLGEPVLVQDQWTVRAKAKAQKRSEKIDVQRKAAVCSIRNFDQVQPRPQEWRTCAAQPKAQEAFGLVRSERFISAGREDSPFQGSGYLCYAEALAWLVLCKDQDIYKSKGIVWRGFKANKNNKNKNNKNPSTIHTVFENIGLLEICRIGSERPAAKGGPIACPNDLKVTEELQLYYEATIDPATCRPRASLAPVTSADNAGGACTAHACLPCEREGRAEPDESQLPDFEYDEEEEADDASAEAEEEEEEGEGGEQHGGGLCFEHGCS